VYSAEANGWLQENQNRQRMKNCLFEERNGFKEPKGNERLKKKKEKIIASSCSLKLGSFLFLWFHLNILFLSISSSVPSCIKCILSPFLCQIKQATKYKTMNTISIGCFYIFHFPKYPIKHLNVSNGIILLKIFTKYFIFNNCWLMSDGFLRVLKIHLPFLLQFVFIASAISASEVPTNPSKIEKSHRFAKSF
jgi:hypothetical protein